MPTFDREAALKLIEQNIRRSGYHVYVVAQGTLPRFAYTIGLGESVGSELVLAGAHFYLAEHVGPILDAVRDHVARARDFERELVVDALGSFRLRRVHQSWIRSLLLGAVDFHDGKVVDAYQIVPDQEHMTIDVPNLANAWSVEGEPVWQWLHAPWPYAIPASSTATTNLAALRGAKITEATRWEDDYWEMFAGAGPDVRKEDIRIVPISSLLAVDPSLTPVLELKIGWGLWREREGASWHPWGESES